jgi:hypothetical protein
MKVMTKPYEEIIEQHGTGTKFVIRTFDESVGSDELVWHRDRESRQVHVLSGRGWKLQHDDELPLELNIGEDHYIPKMTYHRLIKGEDKLVVRIQIT